MKKLMFPAHNVNRHRKLFARAFFDEITAQLPCGLFVELPELKFLFFPKQLFQTIIHLNIL
jgi:hypothetical protein